MCDRPFSLCTTNPSFDALGLQPRVSGDLEGLGHSLFDEQKGELLDNAQTKSFWGRMKTASLYDRHFATRREAAHAVLDWIAFYNHSRLHSTLGYLNPI